MMMQVWSGTLILRICKTDGQMDVIKVSNGRKQAESLWTAL